MRSLKLIKKYQSKITVQDYSKKTLIDGVQIINLNTFPSEDGYFLELARLKEGNIANIDGFKAKQISFSKLSTGGIKGWHLHFYQNDLWFIPPDEHILMGLFDLRENSKTKGRLMRLVLGAHKSQLIFIPKGVAHGYTNLADKDAFIIYITDQEFNIENPDEYRLPYDFLGREFWEVSKG